MLHPKSPYRYHRRSIQLILIPCYGCTEWLWQSWRCRKPLLWDAWNTPGILLCAV